MSALSISAIAEQFDDYAAANRTIEIDARYPCVGEKHQAMGDAYQHCAHFLRERGQLKWSNEVPTEEGWYWYQDPLASSRMHSPIIVSLQRIGDTLYAFDGHATGDPVAEWGMKGCKWAGPIQEPVEETTP